jgi:hypothetical protein
MLQGGLSCSATQHDTALDCAFELAPVEFNCVSLVARPTNILTKVSFAESAILCTDNTYLSL